MRQLPPHGERVSRPLLPGRSCVPGSRLRRLIRHGHVIGTKTCDRPGAGSHGGTVRPHTTPDDSPGRATHAATRGAGTVPPGATHASVGTALTPAAGLDRTTVRPIDHEFIQSPPVDVPPRTARPAVSAVVGPAGPMAGPPTPATRPVSGVPGAVGHPFPGVSDRVGASSTGVPVGRSGPSPERPRPLHLVHHTAIRPFATWTDGTTAGPVDRAPAAAEPSATVRTGSASRVRPAATPLGTPRPGEVDPVVTPD